MKKRIACLMICFITMFSCLSGCSLFVLDQDKYLNEVVAKVGTVEVTKEELLVMYNNYASTLTSNGYTAKQAVDYCLNSLINSAILSQKGKNELVLTEEQMHSSVNETITYFNSLVESYEEKVRAEWDRKTTKPTASDDKKTTYTEFEKQGKLVNVGTSENPDYEIQAVESDDNVEINADYVQIVKDYLDNKEIDLLSQFKKQWVPEFEDVGNEALKRIAIDYKSQFESFKKLSNDEVLEKALEKHFKNVVDNAFISALDEKYDDEIIKSINTQMIMEEYYRIVNENKGKYDLVGAGYEQYVKDVLDSTEGMYYNPVENEFFYVSNILLAFSDEQKAELDAQKTLLEQGAITQKDYDLFKENLAKEIKVNAIDENGNVTDNSYTAEQILLEIQNAVNSCVTAKEKAEAYNKFVYKYNSDTGIQNKSRDYVIGVEKDDDLTRSNMVESFTNASRELQTAGVVGAISGLVLSDYGYHIIQYTGDIVNIEATQNADEVCLVLDNTYTTLHGNKTIFDEILETIMKRQDKCDEVKMLYINDYKAQNKVIKYTDRIKELYE